MFMSQRNKGGVCSSYTRLHHDWHTDIVHVVCCRGGSISSLAYHPSSNMAATTGSSGDIKVWVQQGPSKGRTARWRCQSVGSHTGNTHMSLSSVSK